jgi:hypothetical protein
MSKFYESKTYIKLIFAIRSLISRTQCTTYMWLVEYSAYIFMEHGSQLRVFNNIKK